VEWRWITFIKGEPLVFYYPVFADCRPSTRQPENNVLFGVNLTQNAPPVLVPHGAFTGAVVVGFLENDRARARLGR
jgi:hypothetical protein